MTITGFDHYTVRCADLAASRRFYAEALGLNVADRPGSSVPAAIVSVGDVQVAHLFQATPDQEAVFARMAATDPKAAAWRTGRLQHVGFWATGIAAMRARLQGIGVPFRERTLPDKHQFVLRGPDEVEIEVNFPLSEVP